MSQNKETTVLVLSLLITAGLLGAGFWWLINHFAVDKNRAINHQSAAVRSSSAETFAQVQNVPSGLFSYGGSTTWAPIRRDLDSAIQTVWPQFRLRYTHPYNTIPSSGTGLRMLLDNQLSFAHSSRPVQDKEYQQAQQRGFMLKEVPVAIDGRAVAVNPSLNIPGLTVDQVNDIDSGKITNWSQVGGPDLKITRYAVQGDAAGRFELVPTPTDALRKVAADPGGIFQASAPLIVSQCKIKALPVGRNLNQLIAPYKEPFIPLDQCPAKRNQVNTAVFQSGEYPITRRLLVVIKQNGQIDQQAGEAYANLLLTSQGQELIEKAGFVRIR